jgi:hypothetical protein
MPCIARGAHVTMTVNQMTEQLLRGADGVDAMA